jgi:hypothetical protein
MKIGNILSPSPYDVALTGTKTHLHPRPGRQLPFAEERSAREDANL